MQYEPTPGSRLKEQRTSAGVNAKTLADKLGIDYSTLWRWESDPSVDVIRQRKYEAALHELVSEATA